LTRFFSGQIALFEPCASAVNEQQSSPDRSAFVIRFINPYQARCCLFHLRGKGVKRMKKILALIMVLAFAMTVAVGCTKKEEAPAPAAPATQEQTPAAPAAPEKK
jgi:hypothetical protein